MGQLSSSLAPAAFAARAMALASPALMTLATELPVSPAPEGGAERAAGTAWGEAGAEAGRPGRPFLADGETGVVVGFFFDPAAPPVHAFAKAALQVALWAVLQCCFWCSRPQYHAPPQPEQHSRPGAAEPQTAQEEGEEEAAAADAAEEDAILRRSPGEIFGRDEFGTDGGGLSPAARPPWSRPAPEPCACLDAGLNASD